MWGSLQLAPIIYGMHKCIWSVITYTCTYMYLHYFFIFIPQGTGCDRLNRSKFGNATLILLFDIIYVLVRMTLTVSLQTCQTLKRFSISNQSRLTLTHSKPYCPTFVLSQCWLYDHWLCMWLPGCSRWPHPPGQSWGSSQSLTERVEVKRLHGIHLYDHFHVHIRLVCIDA